MNNNNLNNEDKSEDLLDRKHASSIILKNLIIDFEEQLYSVKIQLKSHISLLQEKEQELIEKERTKVHNQDLFSPIYNKSFDTTELISVIEQLKKRIVNLNEEQQLLINKIKALKTATHCVDSESEYNSLELENQKKINDKGLSILESQEIDRQRIARDLHDTTVQNLTSMVHKAELCVKLIDIDSIRAKLELNTMSNTLKSDCSETIIVVIVITIIAVITK